MPTRIRDLRDLANGSDTISMFDLRKCSMRHIAIHFSIWVLCSSFIQMQFIHSKWYLGPVQLQITSLYIRPEITTIGNEIVFYTKNLYNSEDWLTIYSEINLLRKQLVRFDERVMRNNLKSFGVSFLIYAILKSNWESNCCFCIPCRRSRMDNKSLLKKKLSNLTNLTKPNIPTTLT